MIVRREAFKRFLKRLTGGENPPRPMKSVPEREPAASWQTGSWKEKAGEASAPAPMREEDTLTRR